MDQQNLSAPACAQLSPTRRLIAAGSIRRTPDRTTTVRVTAAGVTGTITPRRTVNHANGADYTVIDPASYNARMARGIHRVTMADGTLWTTGLPIGWHGRPAAWRPTATVCCGHTMTSRDGQLVCRRCGAWIDPGTTPVPAVAQTLDDDNDDACPVCTYWNCRCATSRPAVTGR